MGASAAGIAGAVTTSTAAQAAPEGPPEQGRPRARELGIRTGSLETGKYNAITDVDGVRVGSTTLRTGEGEQAVRTGVTMILPHNGNPFEDVVPAGFHWLNGNGEMTGMAWLRDSGQLSSPIGLTNTGSVGVVRDALYALQAKEGNQDWSLPVVAETWDGVLNDTNGQHVTAEHAKAAYQSARSGPVPEGNVGGGTGMICHGFKGGTGTSSRVLAQEDGGWTVGVLVQANHGRRQRLNVLGVPVGEHIGADVVPLPDEQRRTGSGSIITILATDAPLSAQQCERLAQRTALGIGRTGGAGENGSGDGTLAFSTASAGRISASLEAPKSPYTIQQLPDSGIDALFDAVIESTEEAILNAMLTARTMTGFRGATAHELPHDKLLATLAEYNRGPRH